MRKIIHTLLPVLLFSFILSADIYGQSSVNILRLKKFIAQYETVCNLAPEDTTAINQMVNRFNNLFLNEQVPVYYELDTTTYMKMTVSDYVDAVRGFSKRYFINNISLFDFKITRVRNNGIINVQISKRLEYFPRNVDLDLYYVPPVTITNQLFITLFYTQDETYKIIRVDRADHLFVDGLGSSRFIPSSIAFEPSFLSTTISNDAFEPQGFNAGWAAAVKVNYPLTGKGNFNFLFSPGISFMNINTSVEKTNFTQEITDQTDQDGDLYTLKVKGQDLQESLHVGYLGIPVDFTGIWKFRKASLALRAGLTFAYPLKAKYTIDNADITYSGLYEFEGYPVELYDLPQYGYKQYGKDDFSMIDEPDLSLMFLGHTSLTAGFELSPRLTLTFGPELYFSLNDLIDKHTFPVLIDGEGAATCPNLLTYGEKNSLLAWGLNVGIAYNLKRPNVPFVPNSKFGQLNDYLYTKEAPVYCKNLQTTNIKSSQIKVGFYMENDPQFPGNLKKAPYFYCGVTKSNSQKGSIKAGKNVELTLNVPQDDRKRGDVKFRIIKPYGIDIYKDESQQNPDDPILELTYSDLTAQDKAITLYSREIPPVDIYYVNNYYKDYEDLDRKEFVDEIENIITSHSNDGVHELFLYSAYNADSCAVIRTYSNEKEKIDEFLACIFNFYPEGYLNDIDLFKQLLDQIPCDRRDVNLHFILASPYTYIEYMTDFIDAVSEYKLESNYSNVNIYIHTPFKRVHIDDAKTDDKLNNLKKIYDGMPKSPYIFDYQFEKLFINK